MTLDEWIAAYGSCWNEKAHTPELIAELFTEDAICREQLLPLPARPRIGHEAIYDYFASENERVPEARMIFASPVVDGARVAVEWWANGADAEGNRGSEAGCLLLRFAPDGRCADFRDCWQLIEGDVAPVRGLGRVVTGEPTGKECIGGADGPWPVPAGWPFSHAVRAGSLLFFSGQVAWDEQQRLVGAGDAPAQARQVWANVRTLVEGAGGKLSDVVSVTTYMEDLSLLEAFHSVRPGLFPGGDYPATTDVVVARSSMPGFLLEMEGVAVIGCT